MENKSHFSSADIVITLKNYKLLKDFNETCNNARILLVTGKNETGKSSLIRGLIENMTAKAVTDKPVTEGEHDGNKTFTIPDKDGNPITIVHDFSEGDPKGSFYAIDHLGMKIKSVTKIREIIGIFEELSVDTFYNMIKSAEGRQKIIKDYFYKMIEPKSAAEIQQIDTRTTKGGDLFDMRTDVNASVKALESLIKENVLTDNEKMFIEKASEIESEYALVKKKKDDLRIQINNEMHIRGRIDTLEESQNSIAEEHVKMVSEVKSSISKLEAQVEFHRKQAELYEAEIKQTKKHYEEDVETRKINEKHIDEEIKKLKESLGENKTSMLQELNREIEQAEEVVKMINVALNKKNSYDQHYTNILKKRQEADSLSSKINELRERKKKLIAESRLPAGLNIEGDSFTWNGFAFSDAQISKSSALLVIAEILCNVVESKIVYIGEKALFDKDRFKELVKIAHKHGKIPVLEEVIDNQTEIKVITQIEE